MLYGRVCPKLYITIITHNSILVYILYALNTFLGKISSSQSLTNDLANLNVTVIQIFNKYWNEIVILIEKMWKNYVYFK